MSRRFCPGVPPVEPNLFLAMANFSLGLGVGCIEWLLGRYSDECQRYRSGRGDTGRTAGDFEAVCKSPGEARHVCMPRLGDNLDTCQRLLSDDRFEDDKYRWKADYCPSLSRLFSTTSQAGGCNVAITQ